ncbi:MAG: hypothetical protein GX434_03890 [Peptococcaceae bacterium]|nr:hypothetical protein [Peptococcaceae bacterium]
MTSTTVLTTGNELNVTLGGELEITLEDFLKPESNSIVPLCSKENTLYLDSGRSAIYLALSDILSQGGKREAWLPRYCCQSVELPFLKLGFTLNYYSTGRDLNTPCGLPEKLAGETFLFIHYFGKRNLILEQYLEAMKERHSFFIIEDCVQAMLNSHPGKFDYAVCSFRKFFPQPDGALLYSHYPLEEGNMIEPADEAFVSRRLIGKLIRPYSSDKIFLDLFAEAENMIDNFAKPRKISYISKYLLSRTNAAEITAKRRNNFFYLINGLKRREYDEDLIHPLFDSLEQGEVPLGLPIVVAPSYRDRLREYLADQRVFCPVHWQLKMKEDSLWRHELELSRSILTLPLDQRLDFSSLDNLLAKLSDFFQTKKV